MNIFPQLPNAPDIMGGAQPKGKGSYKASYSCPIYKYKERNDKYLSSESI